VNQMIRKYVRGRRTKPFKRDWASAGNHFRHPELRRCDLLKAREVKAGTHSDIGYVWREDKLPETQWEVVSLPTSEVTSATLFECRGCGDKIFRRFRGAFCVSCYLAPFVCKSCGERMKEKANYCLSCHSAQGRFTGDVRVFKRS
jgi:hypothetical protein